MELNEILIIFITRTLETCGPCGRDHRHPLFNQEAFEPFRRYAPLQT